MFLLHFQPTSPAAPAHPEVIFLHGDGGGGGLIFESVSPNHGDINKAALALRPRGCPMNRGILALSHYGSIGVGGRAGRAGGEGGTAGALLDSTVIFRSEHLLTEARDCCCGGCARGRTPIIKFLLSTTWFPNARLRKIIAPSTSIQNIPLSLPPSLRLSPSLSLSLCGTSVKITAVL